MLKRKYQLSALLLSVMGTFLVNPPSIAQPPNTSEEKPPQRVVITEDDISSTNTTNVLLFFGGNSRWPYSEVLDLREALVDSLVGKVVLDRHWEGGSIFGGPAVGQERYVSVWGSNLESCFIRLFYHEFFAERHQRSGFAVSKIDVGVNKVIYQVSVVPDKSQTVENTFTYNEYKDGIKYEKQGWWYMSSQFFGLTEDITKALIATPEEQIKIRVSFANGTTKIFPIGVGTVKSFKEVYGFNRSCTR